MTRFAPLLPIVLALTIACPAAAGTIAGPAVERSDRDTLIVTWRDTDPVDIFVADKPDATIAQAKLVSNNDRDGRYELAAAGTGRRYFLLRDAHGGGVAKVAERVLPLEHGSNFRDIGGYPAAGGKHVRWGLIYRSGATPLLTDADVRQVQALGLRNLVDLRSSEERVLAPTRLDGIPYTAVGYSMQSLMPQAGGQAQMTSASQMYRGFATLLAPQLRILFADLLAGKGPVAFNCSAGQDRTGFATAMILSALGTPRAFILDDYLLSTGYRHPEYELPRIDPVSQANNPIAMYYARGQQDPAAAKPRPLKEADGTPYLVAAFAEIDARWGSVDAYLGQEIGLNKIDLARLKSLYLE